MNSKYHPVLLLCLCGSLGLGLGCGDKGSGTDSGGDGGSEGDGGVVDHGELHDVAITFNEDFPTVATVTWTTDSPGVSWVDFGVDDVGERSTPVSESSSTEHSVLVLGLVAGQANLLRPSTQLDDGTVLEGGTESVDVELPPVDVPSLSISSVDTEQWNGNGYILTSWMQAEASYVVLLDRQGNHVWWRAADAGLTITTSKPGRDGSSIVFAQYDRNQEEDLGGVVKQPLAGTLDDAILTRTLLGHHDFEELPDDRIAWLSFEETGEGCNPTAGLDAYLVDLILEKDLGSLEEDDADEIWAYADYGVPGYICQHMSVDHYENGTCDWTHGNSLIYDEYEDVYYMMAKNIDNIIKIDRSSGNTVWELGGPNGEFTMKGENSNWWSHGHMSWMGDGEFVVFDNRYHEGGGVGISRASHYVFDEEAKTVERTWTFADPNDNFVQLLGDVRILDNGNYLVSWTQLGVISEITPGGEEVWKMETDIGSAIGRVRYLPTLYDTTLAQ